jgi:ribonucleotide monophosphatase NagD (HAD superfamily)
MHPDDLRSSREKLSDFLSGWSGGPALYQQKHGNPMLRYRHLPFWIGDSERDILAGAAVGAQLHLVLTGNGLATQAAGLPPHTRVHADLAAAARELLRSSPKS